MVHELHDPSVVTLPAEVMLHRSVRESGVSACVKPGVRALQCESEELRRKAEQGSQQLQGEVQELELE
jgi:hypothetical protein